MPTKRIYIDSRFRLPGGTDSDFRYALKTPIELPRGTVGWIDGVVISHSFNSVIQGHNDRLFIREVNGVSIHDRVVTIPAGDYNGFSLAETLEALLNLGTTLPHLWTVVFESGMLTFGNATPAASGGGYVIPREMVETGLGPQLSYWGHAMSPAPPPLSLAGDASRLIGNLLGPAIAVNSSQSHTTEWIDLLPYHQLFLHSHIGAPTSQGPRGENTIARRIVVSGNPSDLIVDHLSTQMDHIELGEQLSTLHFSLRDVEGNLVDTRGHSISFAICIPRD